MVEATKKAFIANYANFKDRTTRADFWWAILGYVIVSCIVGFIGGLCFPSSNGTNIITSLFTLLTIIPCLALEVRRLHDIGKSGWWVLIALVPVVGFIVLLIFYCQPSK